MVADPWFDSRTGNASLSHWEDNLRLFPIGTAVVVQPDKRLTNTAQNKMVCGGVVRQTQSSLVIRTNERIYHQFFLKIP